MIQNVEKSPKVALCRACRGTGVVQRTTELPSRIFRKKKVNITEEACPQCGGSGRVTVSANIELDINHITQKGITYGETARSKLQETCGGGKQDI